MIETGFVYIFFYTISLLKYSRAKTRTSSQLPWNFSQNLMMLREFLFIMTVVMLMW